MSSFGRWFQRGQLLPIFALMLVVLMGMAALAVDAGYWRYQQRLAQTAADAAAIAGADELNYPVLADYSVAAKDDATANGYTADGGVTTTVTVNHPPTSGTYNANASAVQVIISTKQPAFFGGGFGLAAQWVTAEAVALSSPTNRTCVYALGTTGYAVSINGATVVAPHCGIASNSGWEANGSNINAQVISYISGFNASGTSYPQGQPSIGVPVSDPCPSIAGCAYLKANPPSGSCQSVTNYSGGSSATIPAGHYCTQLTVGGVNAVTFAAGVYDFSAGLQVSGASTITGSNVTFYSGPTGAALGLQGSSISLSAPTTGNTAGVMIYQDPANTNGFTMSGGGNGFSGLLYFPSATVQSNGAASNWLLVVANSYAINGNGMNVPTAAFPGSLGHSVLAQ